MNQEEANMILHKMSQIIDNSQMIILNTVLEEILADNRMQEPQKSSNDLLDNFIATKRLEGRSEKTMRCKLNRSDIDFEERECIVLGKGDKERVTYFDARTKLHLIEYLKSRDDSNPALFVSIRKPATRLEEGGVEAMLRKLGERCNVTRCHPHRWRRTCASAALSKGMPIEQVQKMLGHEEISTTLTYLMITDSTVKSSHRKYLG